MGSELDDLRREIGEVDQALLELLRRRLELAAAIGRTKAARGLPVVVRDAEDRVLARARRQAAACGISEEAMEAVFRAIVRGSVERQFRVGAQERALHGQRVLVVGGAGGMGGWFRGFLGQIGHQVDAVDPAWRDLPGGDGRFASLAAVPALDTYAYLLVTVPLERTPEILGELIARSPRGWIVEVASIKSHLGPALDRLGPAASRVLCLHPMFGPGKPTWEPLTFVLAARGEPSTELDALEPLLRHPYARFVTLPFGRHDRLMGWLLGLAHLTGMLFGSALSASGLPASELKACASTTFLRQAATARSILTEDPDLYFAIQRLNPHREEVYAAARGALDRLAGAVQKDDRTSFRELLAAAEQAVTGSA